MHGTYFSALDLHVHYVIVYLFCFAAAAVIFHINLILRKPLRMKQCLVWYNFNADIVDGWISSLSCLWTWWKCNFRPIDAICPHFLIFVSWEDMKTDLLNSSPDNKSSHFMMPTKITIKKAEKPKNVWARRLTKTVKQFSEDVYKYSRIWMFNIRNYCLISFNI